MLHVHARMHDIRSVISVCMQHSLYIIIIIIISSSSSSSSTLVNISVYYICKICAYCALHSRQVYIVCTYVRICMHVRKYVHVWSFISMENPLRGTPCH